MKAEHYRIPLLNGGYALVDADDFVTINDFSWTKAKVGKTNVYAKNKKGIFMHRMLMQCPKGYLVDHKNCNGLDNRRCNLRICTKKENTYNKRPNGRKAPKLSEYKGVTPCGNKFRARITFNKQQYSLGCFETAVEAAKVYNEAAVMYFGQFAWLNTLPTENST